MKLEEMVGKRMTEAQFDEAAGKKDACYHKVKARYDVWPSAYASGALVKCRKVGAKNWGNSKKEGLGDRMSKKLKKLKGVNLKKKKIKLKGKSGRGKISHFGMEGFASNAQRRAAFASGYKAKGKKKKKESVDEGKYEVYFDMGSPGLMSKSVVAKDKKEAAKKVASGLSGKFKIKKVVKESVDEARGTCWVGYQQKGMKDKGGKMVPNCVKEITEIFYEVDGKGYGYTLEYINDGKLNEAEYQGRKVKLGKPMQGDTKKFKVYVKNPKGNVVKVNFGQGGGAKGGTMKIRKSNPGARKSFRARHNCDSPGPRHKARYWSCRKW